MPLTRALRERGYVVTIETAGTVDAEVTADLMSISPKLGNSTPIDDPVWKSRHEANRDAPEVIRRWLETFDYQLKFVVDQPDDVLEIDRYVERFDGVESGRIWLMPQAVTGEQIAELASWIREAAESRGWRVSPRLHIELWGNRPGS